MIHQQIFRTSPAPIDVSFVLPCLNEAQSLAACMAMLREAAILLELKHGLTSEILVADNGSTDGSQAIATAHGARVIAVAEPGYGAALRGGFAAAQGRHLVMGDADGSYDFREAVAMIEKLEAGADICIGSRFSGGIHHGAMPWLNRYVGNPVLTGLLNLMFGANVGDAHCGLRAIRADRYDRLRLEGSGMEFASEMIVKACLGYRIEQTPATLSPDLRGRPPHLRPWRDGWRHLRYLFMLCPAWLFAAPAAIAVLLATIIFGGLALKAAGLGGAMFGNSWAILGATLMGLGHSAALLAAAVYLYGLRQGYRRPTRLAARLGPFLRLETMLIGGGLFAAGGFAILLTVLANWNAGGFAEAPSVVPAVVGALMLTLGVQNMLGGFLLAVLGGNEARSMERATVGFHTVTAPADTVTALARAA